MPPSDSLTGPSGHVDDVMPPSDRYGIVIRVVGVDVIRCRCNNCVIRVVGVDVACM